jgi:hydroxymethylglutaryl-CoA lyase
MGCREAASRSDDLRGRPRDGLQNEARQVPTADKIRSPTRWSRRVRNIEITSFVSPK